MFNSIVINKACTKYPTKIGCLVGKVKEKNNKLVGY